MYCMAVSTRNTTKNCPICTKEFTSRALTCSHLCKWSLKKQLNPKPVEPAKFCVVCSKEHFFHNRKTCSNECMWIEILASRGHQKQEVLVYICKECNTNFEKRTRNTETNHTYEFCGHKCASTYKSRIGGGFATNAKRYAYWEEKYGPEIAQQKVDALTKGRSETLSKRNTGRVVTDETRKKTSKSVKNCGFKHPWTNKTLEEAVGPERAAQLANDHSEKLLEGFKTGRLTPNVATKRATRGIPQLTSYGFWVRSKNEFYFVQRLEELGLVWNVDWTYENRDDRVQYYDPVEEKERTYFPDFNVRGQIVEIKDNSKSERNDPVVLAKEAAAKKVFDSYSIVTKRKISKWIPDCLLDESV
mgnify:CR=1 FL=1